MSASDNNRMMQFNLVAGLAAKQGLSLRQNARHQDNFDLAMLTDKQVVLRDADIEQVMTRLSAGEDPGDSDS